MYLFLPGTFGPHIDKAIVVHFDGVPVLIQPVRGEVDRSLVGVVLWKHPTTTNADLLIIFLAILSWHTRFNRPGLQETEDEQRGRKHSKPEKAETT